MYYLGRRRFTKNLCLCLLILVIAVTAGFAVFKFLKNEAQTQMTPPAAFPTAAAPTGEAVGGAWNVAK